MTNQLEETFVQGIVCVARNISEQRQAASDLERQRNRFEQLFAGSPEAIAILDAGGRILDVNAAFEELFGFPCSRIQGKSLDECIVPASHLEEARAISEAVRSGHLRKKETTRCRSDNKQIDVSLTAYPIRQSGQVVGAYAVFVDITQRKAADRQILHDALSRRFDRSAESISIPRSPRSCPGPHQGGTKPRVRSPLPRCGPVPGDQRKPGPRPGRRADPQIGASPGAPGRPRQHRSSLRW